MVQSPHGVKFESNRPVVMGRNGMVCAGQPLAAQAGMAILQKGGNAVDAAIGTAAALNVVEPNMSGIGGDGYIMIYNKAQNKIDICNATGAAPYATDLARYQAEGIPQKGIRSVSVPGLLDGWLAAHDKYATLKLSELFAAAIDLADNGFPVSHVLSQVIAADSLLQEFPTSQAIFAPGGKPPKPGVVLYQKDLAKTFQAIAEGGRDAFYQGPIAEAMVKFCQEQGGLLSMKDLADCRSRWEEPISTTYKGYSVYEAPPNSSGHILLQELNMVEQFDLRSMGCSTAESIHMMVEAKKLAFIDREAYMADPDHTDVPTLGLISKEYAKERAKLIDPDRAADPTHGDPWVFQGSSGGAGRVTAGSVQEEDTTCFVIVDRWGNSVCQLQSIQSSLGSSLVAGDTGILLNNRMTYWHLDPDHVDCLQPGKRVRHTMNPVMVFNGDGPASMGKPAGTGSLMLVCGTPGADTQVQTNMQVITHLIDFGMTVSEAVEAPRWRNSHSPTESNVPHTCDNLLHMESRFGLDVRQALESRGHQLNMMPDWGAQGSEMMIQVDSESGALHGAADPRRDGYAIGW
ncbi:MAG TPA: gamma-glutamyltransferase [Dehalococcoidia bacterium]|nr:gamma-glutamyltransferase [Dehalococcoidia bacterium]HIN22984.1 gamma-glutamyltransferase [Dehalococcoidia bacterium]